MSNTSIQFRWPYAYAWAFLDVLFLGWGGWAFRHLNRWQASEGFFYLFVTLVLLELLGAWRNDIHDRRGEPERIRTQSQLMQRIGEMAKEDVRARWHKGWPLLASGFCAYLAVAAGIAFWYMGPFIGSVSVTGCGMPLVIFFWNQPHWLKRWRFG